MDLLRVVWFGGDFSPRLVSLWERLRAGASSRAGRIGLFLAAVAGALLAIHLRFSPQGALPCDADFYAYYHSALALQHGIAPYGPLAAWIRAYVPGQPLDPFTTAACLHGRLEFAFTPIFGLLFIPFTWLPYGAALVVWDACELLLLCAAIYAFLRAAGIAPSPLHMLVLADVAMFAGPFRFVLYYAQADIFLLACICAALWARTRGRPVLAGLLLALACASEPALLALVALLLWKREWRFALVALGSALILILAPFLWLGGKALGDLVLIWRFYANLYALNPSNNAPKGVLLRLFTPSTVAVPLANAPWLVTPLWLLIALAVLFFAASRIARQPLAGDPRSLLDLGLAAAALLLISPYSENNHFTLLLLPFLAVYALLLRPGWRTPSARRLALGFVAALFLVYVLGDPVQFATFPHQFSDSPTRVVFILLGATYLYPLLAISAVVLYARSVIRAAPVLRQPVRASAAPGDC